MSYNLTNATLEDLTRLVFDHPVAEPAEDGRPNEWYWADDVELEIDPVRQLELATTLLIESGGLRWKYSEEQLEQGLWFMFGPGGEKWFVGLLRDEELTVPLRRRFVRAIGDLYEQLLSRVQLETATFMLWDLIIDQFYTANSDGPVVPIELQDTIFETLVRILALPDQACQHAALHGLGHLHHRDTAAVVTDYLARSPGLPEEIVEYAHHVRDGDRIL